MTPEATRLVEANIKLAQKLAWEYARKWGLLPKLRIDMDDLLSIMYLELCTAAQSYDPTRGYTFATYFYQCGLNAARMLIRNSHANRRRASITAVSLDMPVDVDGRVDGRTLADMIPADEPTPEDVACAASDVAMLRRSIAALPERRQKILYMHYWQDMQQRRIGEVAGMAQANVSRILRDSRQRIKDMITTLEAGAREGGQANENAGRD